LTLHKRPHFPSRTPHRTPQHSPARSISLWSKTTTCLPPPLPVRRGLHPLSDVVDILTSLRPEQDTPAKYTPTSPSMGERLKFFTINAQKAGANSPSLTDLVTLLDQQSPDFLLIKETPMHPHSGALLHVLRNREYRVHHHPSNASFHPDGLPEARLPA
jgi:hypothetical protein